MPRISRDEDFDSQYAEPATGEMYSGPGGESVPSSFSAYHPYHGRSHSRSSDRSSSRRPSLLKRTDSQTSMGAISVSSRDTQMDEHLTQHRNRSRSRSSFRFFSWNEVEAAESAGTHEDELDPIDYARQEEEDDDDNFPHTEDEANDKYSQRGMSFSYYRRQSAGTEADEHGPLLETVRSNPVSSMSGSFSEPQTASSAYGHSTRLQQRFYISEEDLMLAIAGYRSSKFRYFLYIIVCISTFGMAYLILRWFPRLWIKFLGTPCPLGYCDWMVIENQWGQLEFLNVRSKRYNRALSTIFRSSSATEGDDIEQSTLSTGNSSDEHGPDTSSFIIEKSDPDVPLLRTINYRYITLYYHPLEDIFKTNFDWTDPDWVDLENISDGLDYDLHSDRQMVFGLNLIDIDEPPITKLLVDEVLHPFYIFQVFSILLWSLDEYYYYASCIFIISILSVGNALLETKQTLHRLKNISKFECRVRVYRNGYWNDIPSSQLVPGDIFEISDPNISLLPCDAVLLSGDCILNESMLTGESVPVSKFPATQETLKDLVAAVYNVVDPDDDNMLHKAQLLGRHLLYNGTKIVKVTKPKRRNAEGEFDVALAMVVKTGFSTTKGALVRSMLFPKPSGFKFYEDSFKYIGVMGLIAVIGFTYSTINFIKMNLDTSLIVFRALDLITIVVPPALPATLTIGTNISLSRLRSKSIFCISPNRVNVGGKLDVVCFDKTGTLTEDGLDVLGIQLVDRGVNKFGSMLKKIKKMTDKQMLAVLTTCHGLRLVEGDDEGDGKVIGDPLDVKMFEFSDWRFEEHDIGGGHFVRISRPDDSHGTYLQTGKMFDFVSQLRRMTVIVDEKGEGSSDTKYAYLKGAPEIMSEVCDPATFPKNYKEQLHFYTHKGNRVIACAYKKLEPTFNPAVATRKQVESGMTFVGFIIFENKLKEQTTSVIEELRRANIRTVMCTGDNVLTAVSVGRECKIIAKNDDVVFSPHFEEEVVEDSAPVLKWECIDDPSLTLDPDELKPVGNSIGFKDYTFAVTGDAFRHIIEYGTEQQLEQVLMNSSVFARMSPDEKHELVEKLQELSYTTGFCGDGANDCGALKAADVGISLSEAESSVAAPFTSRVFEISCVLDVIKEGRCALATSFSCFKYMSLYSAIQFVSVSLLYSVGSNLGDFQFLWIDLFLILPIAIFMAWSKPYGVLSKKRPTANLVSRKVLVPLLGNIAVFTAFQLGIWYLARKESHQPWYVAPILGASDEEVESTENTTLFGASCFQYIFTAIILAQGRPYRQPIYKNVPFCLSIIVTWLLSMFILDLDETTWAGRLMNMTFTPRWFEGQVMLLIMINFAMCWLGEVYVFPQMSRVVLVLKRAMGITKTRKRYKVLRDTNMTV